MRQMPTFTPPVHNRTQGFTQIKKIRRNKKIYINRKERSQIIPIFR